MTTSIYVEDAQQQVHRGAIYSYRPVPWLEPPPLWLVRDAYFGSPSPYARLCRDTVNDAFRLGKAADNQEYVLAKAKKRFLIVLSPDVEAKRGGVHQLVIAPAYTLHEERNPQRAQEIRAHSSPHTFYLRADPSYPDVGECYLDFRQVQPIHRKWLEVDKLGICLTSWAVKAVLFRFKSYLLIR